MPKQFGCCKIHARDNRTPPLDIQDFLVLDGAQRCVASIYLGAAEFTIRLCPTRLQNLENRAGYHSNDQGNLERNRCP